MADEIRVEHEPPIVDDPDTARAEIAMTRARMSETIDDIEDVLIRRKERIQDRMDIFAPIRERPLQAAAAVFGAGLILGLLTGGDDEDESEYEFEFSGNGRGFEDAERRADTWERRARRLLSIAKEQRELAGGGRFMEDDDWSGDWSEHGDDDESQGALAGMRDVIADRLAPIIGSIARELLSGNRRS